jgi:hypothetical protein
MVYLAVFLLGYLLAAQRSAWEQRNLVEGVVAHFGIWKGLRPGLRDDFEALQNDLASAARPLEIASSKPDGREVPSKELHAHLARAAARVEMMKGLYGYTDQEQAAVERYVLSRYEELTRDRREAKAGAETGKASPAVEPKPRSDAK